MKQPEDSPPLWRQLQSVAQVVLAVQQGSSATTALAAVQTGLRPGVQALVYRVLRSLGRAQALRRQLAPRKPSAAADALLCTALGLGWRVEDAPYDMFTLVSQAVEAAKHTAATRAQSGFINACLRRFAREQEALVRTTDADPVALWNYPSWWIARVQREYPAHWQAVLAAGNRQAPMTLRVNIRKTTVAAYRATLAAAGIEASPTGPCGLVLHKPLPVQDIPGFMQGWVSVQDAAAQMAAPLLLDGMSVGTRPHILDACAAPGGKTAHLLELADADVTALDIDPLRCERIDQNLARLGLTARVLAADAGEPKTWWDGQLFDAILLDAPCTASGIVRRHPDVRWLRRESDVTQLAVIQLRLLTTLWLLLKPGGRLLYCTCSVFHAEGDEQIQAFLAHNTQARLLPSPGHLRPTFADEGDTVRDNQVYDHDGFYYALLEKGAA